MVDRFLLWDFDGTLARRTGGWTGALTTVLERHAPGIVTSADEIRPYLKSGFPWHAPENPHLGLSPDEWWEDLTPVFIRAFRAAGVMGQQAFVLAQEVRGVYTDPCFWQRYEDALPALESLRAYGWKHILLSNHVPELPALIEHLGFGGCFTATFNSAQTGYEKPNPRAFRAVVDWSGPEVVRWMVGDSYTADYLGARESGIPSVLVRTKHPDAGPNFETLQQLVEFLT